MYKVKSLKVFSKLRLTALTKMFMYVDLHLLMDKILYQLATYSVSEI